MKKLLFVFVMLLSAAGVFAQAQPKKDSARKASTKVLPQTKPAAQGPVKKDGSADMRYKANKEAAKPAPAGPVKKDGTADMRYKANKTAKDSTKKKG